MFRRRQGFTFVELLVVIAIIGILVALLLPAVRFSRDVSGDHLLAKSPAANYSHQVPRGMSKFPPSL